MFNSISLLHDDRFSGDYYNRDSFDETIEMRSDNPMLTSKLHVLLHMFCSYPLSVDEFSQDFYNRAP